MNDRDVMAKLEIVLGRTGGGQSLYHQQIADLTEWFEIKLRTLGIFEVTPHMRIRGVDVIPEPWKSLTKEAFDLWLSERSYELSYNQMCCAFFVALEQSEKAVHL